MRKILILFAHPRLEKSRANESLLQFIPHQENITLHDLYEEYSNFNIDVEAEQKLLMEHEVIVWHHPFYWYSCPPLLKQWIDMVLEFGWAYGPDGTALKDKIIFNAITTGGAREAYGPEGKNRFTIKELLSPFEQTAWLCKMIYLPPFAVQGTHRLTDDEILNYSEQYSILLDKFSGEKLDIEELRRVDFLNDVCVRSLKKA